MKRLHMVHLFTVILIGSLFISVGLNTGIVFDQASDFHVIPKLNGHPAHLNNFAIIGS